MIRFFISFRGTSSSSTIIINCVSTLKSEPIAISKKRLNSISLFLPQPPAIFEGIETAARVI